MKSKRLRALLCGTPSILIHNGKLMMEEIRRQSYSLNDLLEQLRASGTTDISEVRYAILETNGNLSVMPYAHKNPVCPEDLGICVEDSQIFTPVVLDGKVYEQGMGQLGYDRAGILKLLHTLGFDVPFKEIFLFLVSPAGNVFVQDKQGKTKSARLPFSLSTEGETSP